MKPENIVVFADGTCKLSDFGLAIDFDLERPVTRAGTLQFVSPEVLNQPEKNRPEDHKETEGYTQAADVFSLGILVFEMITGRNPFKGDTRKETMKNILNAEAIIPTELSLDAQDFLRSCLYKDPKKRSTILQLKSHRWLMSGRMPLPLSSVVFPLRPKRLSVDSTLEAAKRGDVGSKAAAAAAHGLPCPASPQNARGGLATLKPMLAAALINASHGSNASLHAVGPIIPLAATVPPHGNRYSSSPAGAPAAAALAIAAVRRDGLPSSRQPTPSPSPAGAQDDPRTQGTGNVRFADGSAAAAALYAMQRGRRPNGPTADSDAPGQEALARPGISSTPGSRNRQAVRGVIVGQGTHSMPETTRPRAPLPGPLITFAKDAPYIPAHALTLSPTGAAQSVHGRGKGPGTFASSLASSLDKKESPSLQRQAKVRESGRTLPFINRLTVSNAFQRKKRSRTCC